VSRVVFDLDGTLIDSAPDIRQIANEVLAAEDRPPVSLAETKGFIGSGAPKFVERMRAARDLPDAAQDRMLERFVTLYDDAVGLTRPYPGAVAALEALAAAGHRLGLCTNKPLAATQAVLDHLDLARHFEIVLGGNSLPQRKPDPAPLHAAFAALGTGHRIYVGDSEVDAETARRAGVAFLLFTEGYRKSPAEALPHQAAFDDFARLPALVTGAEAALT